MSTNERLVECIESSFLAPLLSFPNVTDVSYNGEAIFYEDAERGRQKADLTVSNEEVGAFLRQIANFSEKQFSYMSPILDVSFSRYRLNATYQSLTRVRDAKAYSFALRLEREGSVLRDDDDLFWGKARIPLLEALERRESIVIAGETGAGKTELQKYLLLHLPKATRVIVIYNVEELELSRSPDLDLTSWQVDERLPSADFPHLIRNALRNNPDYLLVAESRGAEMLDALNAVMSGHPIITTLHAKDIHSIPTRMARMVLMGPERLLLEDVLADIYHHFSWMVFLSKRFVDGRVIRRIEQLGYADEKTGRIEIVYQAGKEGL